CARSGEPTLAPAANTRKRAVAALGVLENMLGWLPLPGRYGRGRRVVRGSLQIICAHLAGRSGLPGSEHRPDSSTLAPPRELRRASPIERSGKMAGNRPRSREVSAL